MTFVEKLRKLRETAGLSEARLADLSGVPFGTLHGYALGLRRPTLAAGLKLARALKVSCDVFGDCEDLLDAEPAEPPPAKKPRGRPRKVPATTEATPESQAPAEPSEGQRKGTAKGKKARKPPKS